MWLSSPLMANVSPLLAPPPATGNAASSNPSTIRIHSETTTTILPQNWSSNNPFIFPNAPQSDVNANNSYYTIPRSVPPSTPAIQFYPSSCHKSTTESNGTFSMPQPHRYPIPCTHYNFPTVKNTGATTVNSSSSSPSSNINNNTDNDDSNIHTTNGEYHQISPNFMQQMQSLLNPDLVQPSNVTPAASLSSTSQTNSSTEYAMLPPPPRIPRSDETILNPEASNTVTMQSSVPINVDIQHLNWIRELNERARQMLNAHHSSLSNTSSTSTVTTEAPPAISQIPSQPIQHHFPAPHLPPTHSKVAGVTTSMLSSSPPATTSNNQPPQVNTNVTCDWHQQSLTSSVLTVSASSASAPSGVESEERRARRLERNRESARLSRRRKKETLLFLGKKVQKLQDSLDKLRAAQVLEMESQLASIEVKNDVNQMILRYKQHADVRKQVSIFQYNTMKETLLPQHYQFLLWISNHPADTFYTAAKDSRPKGSSKMSSKQIGEEIFSTERQQLNQRQSNRLLECKTDDVNRFWPLFCYEMSFSVEQEEKFKSRYMDRLSKIRQQRRRKVPSATEGDKSSVIRLASAFALVSKLSETTSIHDRYNVVAIRRKRLLLQILSESQCVAFLRWMKVNMERCTGLSRSESMVKSINTAVPLDQLCEELERTLNINNRCMTSP